MMICYETQIWARAQKLSKKKSNLLAYFRGKKVIKWYQPKLKFDLQRLKKI